MTTLKFGDFWDWTAGISWNLVLHNVQKNWEIQSEKGIHISQALSLAEDMGTYDKSRSLIPPITSFPDISHVQI